MSPADSLVWAVAAASAAWLFVSVAIPAALRGLVAVGSIVQPISRPVATLVAAILLVGVVRSSPSAADVPPPTERVIVEGGQDAAAVTIRHPISPSFSAGRTGTTHTVVRGDTLWGIARDILDQRDARPTGAEIATAWKLIYATNTEVVGHDPNLIHPGQVLTIPGGIHG
jgi:nucleoid-associated protein YgaU